MLIIWWLAGHWPPAAVIAVFTAYYGLGSWRQSVGERKLKEMMADATTFEELLARGRSETRGRGRRSPR